MKNTTTPLSPRERILAAASELFYRQGYRATGVNEVIQQADVAKATFFSHFPTKDDLCLAYLREKSVGEMDALRSAVMAQPTPLASFLSMTDVMAEWLKSTNYRGCPFMHIITEVPNPEGQIHKEAWKHYEMLRQMLQEVSQLLIASDPKAYGHLEANKLADIYLLNLIGAISLAEMYRDTWPIDQARILMEAMLKTP